MTANPAPPARRATDDGPLVRWGLTAAAVLLLTGLIVVPVVHVFYEAVAGFVGQAREYDPAAGPATVVVAGLAAYARSLADPDTLHAIRLTLTVAPIAVALNLVFGLAAAWAIARFRFPGRTLLTTLIDLPFSVSPVVAGLVFVLLFGLQGYFGHALRGVGVNVIFAVPGLVLTTAFVTLPFVARELIPVMEAIGPDEELAAISLGASGPQTFWYVTLPNIKWGLLYGLILCNARAMGEFGAVYVVSGRIPGQTATIPLRVEMLYQEYKTPESFALASVLTLLALATLLVKVALERRVRAAAAPDRPAATEGNPT